ncbi:MAG: CBS domain-containing protein [Thaumarchaeota archaeon]|nr:CBS domain-containing protein [Nitrososphaerota archaeon]
MVLYAKDIVEMDFLSLPPETTVLEGAKAMKGSRHGFAVVGAPNRPEGIVTEWDVLSKVVAEGRDARTMTLGEIMSKDLVSIDAEAGLSMVSQTMAEKGVRRLLVKQGGEVVGVITAKTMLEHLNDYVDKVSAQIGRLQAPWF